MEYTRSKGEHSYETFEGTPEEIAKLIKAIDKDPVKPIGVAPLTGLDVDFSKLSEAIQDRLSVPSKMQLEKGLGTKSL